MTPTSFGVEGVEPARVKDMGDLLRDFFRNDWEVRDAGEGKFDVRMTDLYERHLRDQTVQEAIRTLERRVNALGVAEPVIAATGSRNDQILVQLPGVTDVEQAKRIIKTTAQLTLKLVESLGRDPGHAAAGRRRQGAGDDGARLGAERHAGPADLLPAAQGVADHRA